MRGEADNFVNDTLVQSTLRELRETYADGRVLVVIALVGVVAGLTGPFNTYSELGAPLRLLYWLLVAALTYAVGLVGGRLLAGWLVPGKRPLWLHVPVMAVGGAIPVTLAVLGLNALFGLSGLFDGWAALALLAYCFCIALVVIALLDGLLAPMLRDRAAPAPNPASPPILDRLPHDLRAPLTHMSASDHYVEVFTSKGSALVLIRLSDAMRETGGTRGFQVHRSHWVARDAIKGLRRVEGRPVIELVSGARLPVSRSFLAPLKAGMARS